MAVQGEVSGWVLNHRAHHHFQDQPGLDPHSPLEYPGMRGLLWAHIGWLLFRFELPVQFRTSARMEADPLVRWQRPDGTPMVSVVGEITVAGPTATDSYFNRDAQTALAKIRETLPDGRRQFRHTTLFPVLDAHGELAGMAGVVRDVTARRRAKALK